jgi:hypothetical protein
LAHVAELVDAHGSGPCAARCGGSSPSVGTRYKKEVAKAASFFYCACEHSTLVLPLTQHCTCVLYLIYLAEPMEADPGSSHRTSRMADESTDYPADIQRNNQVG